MCWGSLSGWGLTLPELRMPLSMHRNMTTQAASKHRARGQRTGPGSSSPLLFTTPRTFSLNTQTKNCVIGCGFVLALIPPQKTGIDVLGLYVSVTAVLWTRNACLLYIITSLTVVFLDSRMWTNMKHEKIHLVTGEVSMTVKKEYFTAFIYQHILLL